MDLPGLSGLDRMYAPVFVSLCVCVSVCACMRTPLPTYILVLFIEYCLHFIVNYACLCIFCAIIMLQFLLIFKHLCEHLW